jgi:hypothetical protein
MSSLTTKFAINDVCYSFDSVYGIIYRHVVDSITIVAKNNDMEIQYHLSRTTPTTGMSVGQKIAHDTKYEQQLYTETEVKDIANTWLIEKSVSIFANVGL